MAKTTKSDGKLFATADEAKANKPAGKDKWQLWSVSHAEKGTRFVWCDGASSALRTAARADGYSARLADKPVSRVAVAAQFAALTPEDRAILIAAYVPKPNGQTGTSETTPPAPAPTAPGKKRN